MPGSRRASMVLPAPGGPTSNRLCEPAAAISRARAASDCPTTSPRSGVSSGGGSVRRGRVSLRAVPSRRAFTSSARVRGAMARALGTRRASARLSGGTISRASLVAATCRATASTPRTLRSCPSRPSSPTAQVCCSVSAGSCPLAASRASAMGRSKAVPVFGRSPGWRFTVILRGGIVNPEFASAACTRSRLSFTAVAASPTSVH